MNREQRRQAQAARKRAVRKSYETKRNVRNNQAKPSAPHPIGRDSRRKIANAPGAASTKGKAEASTYKGDA